MSPQGEFKGHWWLPIEPDRVIAGLLKYDEKGRIDLELFDAFGQLGSDDEYYEVIHGYVEDGMPVTLFECRVASTKLSFPSYGYMTRRQKISPRIFILGFQFSTLGDLQFQSISVKLSNLGDWVDSRSIDTTWLHPENEYTIQLNNYELSAKFDDKVFEIFQTTTPTLGRQPIKFTQHSHLRIEWTSPIPFDGFRNVLKNAQNFISFGVGEPVYLLEVVAKTNRSELPIGIIWRRLSSGKPFKNFPTERMLFSLEDIEPYFEKYLRDWLNKTEKLQTVYDLYFSIVYGASDYIDVQFLLLAQALESYHRKAHGGNYMSQDDYEPIRKTLNKDVDKALKGLSKSSDFKSSLKQKIRYGHELTLGTRLQQLFDNVLKSFGPVLDEVIENRKEFNKRIRITRNYLTHFEVDERDELLLISDFNEKYYYTQVMKLLLQMCFLFELEMTGTEWLERIRRTPTFEAIMLNKPKTQPKTDNCQLTTGNSPNAQTN